MDVSKHRNKTAHYILSAAKSSKDFPLLPLETCSHPPHEQSSLIVLAAGAGKKPTTITTNLYGYFGGYPVNFLGWFVCFQFTPQHFIDLKKYSLHKQLH